MNKHKKIVILIPCHNEEKGIGKVIDAIPKTFLKKYGYSIKVIVIDNSSSDKTAETAKEHGARVVPEEKRGKGNAVRKGFTVLPNDAEFVVVIDGDNTYKANEIPRLIEPIENNFADMIIGSRLSGRTYKGSLTTEHKLANWLYTFLVRHFYRVNTTDVLSGFIALRKSVIEKLLPHIESKGFEIEMEINIKTSRLGYKIFSVPITYDIRQGNSKIEGFKDALGIFIAFFKYLTWKGK